MNKGKKIAISGFGIVCVFAVCVYFQIAPAPEIKSEYVDSLFAIRSSGDLEGTCAVYLYAGPSPDNAEIKFFIGPDNVLNRLSRQNAFTGKDNGWIIRWIQGEYPAEGLS